MKKPILSKAEAAAWLRADSSASGFTLVYTKSHQVRVYDAYGKKLMVTSGHGYSKSGVCVAAFIRAKFNGLLFPVGARHGANHGSGDNREGLYGLSVYRKEGRGKDAKRSMPKYAKEGDTVDINGMCGDDCMISIMRAMGFDVQRVAYTDESTTYSVRPISKNYWQQAAYDAGVALRAKYGHGVE